MKYGIYIISRGRADKCLTALNLVDMKIPFTLVVDEDEFEKYKKVFNGKCNLVVYPKVEYEAKYDTLDEFGTSKPVGPGAKRNFVWDLSISKGEEFHFVCDDNIEVFLRRTGNCHFIAKDNKFFQEMINFIIKADLNNVGIFGPEYSFFVPARSTAKAFRLNCRIFSVLGIRNNLPIRWRGRYNEDVILSFDCLSKGYATLLFQTHLQKKVQTQTMKGGNTDAFYKSEGTLLKTDILVKNFPQYASKEIKFGRIHHKFDFFPFRNNLLRKSDNLKEDLKYLNVDYLTKVWNELGDFIFFFETPCQIIINFMSVHERELFIKKFNLEGNKKKIKNITTGFKKPAKLSCWYLSTCGFVDATSAKKIYKKIQLEKTKKVNKLKDKKIELTDENLF